tara:strand:- start:18 stop:440 length:423 start_codon:yes stop_codon:yes gene_type:complete
MRLVASFRRALVSMGHTSNRRSSITTRQHAVRMGRRRAGRGLLGLVMCACAFASRPVMRLIARPALRVWMLIIQHDDDTTPRSFVMHEQWWCSGVALAVGGCSGSEVHAIELGSRSPWCRIRDADDRSWSLILLGPVAAA